MKKIKAFDVVMIEATDSMPFYQRSFSKVVHASILSHIGDLLGNTIARPNALLFGGICSFILTLSLYVLSKNLGYSLSGFEPVGGFFIGWVYGICFDLMKYVFKRKK